MLSLENAYTMAIPMEDTDISELLPKDNQFRNAKGKHLCQGTGGGGA